MTGSERFDAELDARLESLRAKGRYKSERMITSMQAGEVALAGGQRVINLCANNYPGLADDPEVIAAAKAGLDRYGFGMASVRFICGTQCGVMGRVDILTGTLGKALGGASDGYTAASAPVVDWLRQRSRPYLFSNTLAPVIALASLQVFDLLERRGDALRARLWKNAAHFCDRMGRLGVELLPGGNAIIPVMLRAPKLVQEMAARLGAHGVYVTAFSYPVVPRGQDRIRTQMSAALGRDMLDRAIDAFETVGRELGVIE